MTYKHIFCRWLLLLG